MTTKGIFSCLDLLRFGEISFDEYRTGRRDVIIVLLNAWRSFFSRKSVGQGKRKCIFSCLVKVVKPVFTELEINKAKALLSPRS